MTNDKANWDIEGIKRTFTKHIDDLNAKTKEELINDIIELTAAIHPFVVVLTYLIDKGPQTVYAMSDLFPDKEWDLDIENEELPDDFVIMHTGAHFRAFSDTGGDIEIQNVKYLEETLDKIYKKP